MEDATQTLTGQLAGVIREAADRTALIYREGDVVREFTYGEVYRHSLAVAGWLQAQKVEKGDRVAIFLENRPQWPIGYFGALLAGAVAVPLDPVSRWDHIHYTLEQTRAKVIFTFPQAPLSQLQELPFLEKIVVVGENGESDGKIINFSEVLQSPGSETNLPSIGPDDLASIIYTSGTTGIPKGVMLTHKNFCANYRGIAQLNAVRPDDNLLAILPLHHAFPFTATLLLPLFSRVKITYLDTLKAEAILRCVKEQRVTILVLTPQVLQHFYQGMKRQLELIPWPLRPLLLAYLNFSRRCLNPGDKSGKPLPRNSECFGRAVWFLPWRGQTARVSGGEPGAAGIYGAGRLRPDGDRAGGYLQLTGSSPFGVRGAAPFRGGSQNSLPRGGRHRRGPHPGRQRHARVFPQ
jgi:long-chain acyl-CoA synthetase